MREKKEKERPKGKMEREKTKEREKERDREQGSKGERERQREREREREREIMEGWHRNILVVQVITFLEKNVSREHPVLYTAIRISQDINREIHFSPPFFSYDVSPPI